MLILKPGFHNTLYVFNTLYNTIRIIHYTQNRPEHIHQLYGRGQTHTRAGARSRACGRARVRTPTHSEFRTRQHTGELEKLLLWHPGMCCTLSCVKRTLPARPTAYKSTFSGIYIYILPLLHYTGVFTVGSAPALCIACNLVYYTLYNTIRIIHYTQHFPPYC